MLFFLKANRPIEECMKKPITLILSEPGGPLYTKKQARKLVHDAFKAGLINTYYARSSNDLSGQNSRLFALKRLFPRTSTEGQPGHITRKQESAARAIENRLAATEYLN